MFSNCKRLEAVWLAEHWSAPMQWFSQFFCRLCYATNASFPAVTTAVKETEILTTYNLICSITSQFPSPYIDGARSRVPLASWRGIAGSPHSYWLYRQWTFNIFRA